MQLKEHLVSPTKNTHHFSCLPKMFDSTQQKDGILENLSNYYYAPFSYESYIRLAKGMSARLEKDFP